MYQNNAIMYYRHVTGHDPHITEHIGNFPEEDPTSFVYRFLYGSDPEIETHIVVQITENGLLSRQLSDDELKSLAEFKDA